MNANSCDFSLLEAREVEDIDNRISLLEGIKSNLIREIKEIDKNDAGLYGKEVAPIKSPSPQYQLKKIQNFGRTAFDSCFNKP